MDLRPKAPNMTNSKTKSMFHQFIRRSSVDVAAMSLVFLFLSVLPIIGTKNLELIQVCVCNIFYATTLEKKSTHKIKRKSIYVYMCMQFTIANVNNLQKKIYIDTQKYMHKYLYTQYEEKHQLHNFILINSFYILVGL